MSPLRVLRQIVRPSGQHRARPAAPLAVIAQGWRPCTNCDRPRAAVLHADHSWTCGICGTGGA